MVNLVSHRVIQEPGALIELAGDETVFITREGLYNPRSLDGAGTVRAKTGFLNSIGFNSIDPDKDNYTFVNNLEVKNGIINHSKSSGVIRNIGLLAKEEIVPNHGLVLFANKINGWNDSWIQTRGSESIYGKVSAMGVTLNNYIQVQENEVSSVIGGQFSVSFTRTINPNQFISNNPDLAGSILSKETIVSSPSIKRSVAVAGTSLILNRSDTFKTTHFDQNGDSSISASVAASLAGTVNNYSPANLDNVSILRLNVTANSIITGIVAPTVNRGKKLFIINTGTFKVTLKNNDAGSTANNRIISNANVDVKAGCTVQLYYNYVDHRWQIVQ